MKKSLSVTGLLTVLTVLGAEIKAPISGVIIYTNGVSAVRRTAEIGKQTEFELACDLAPLQGSLWFSNPAVSVVRKKVKKPTPWKYPLDNITKTFAGKSVTLHLSNGNGSLQEISGVIWDPDPNSDSETASNESETRQMPSESIVWIKRNDRGGFEMIQRDKIIRVCSPDKPQAAYLPEQFNLRPAWIFSLSKPAQKPLEIEYLSMGLSWESAYRIVLKNNGRMMISQDAEIINRLDDLNNVSLYLASGHANFVNKNQSSPMEMVQPTRPQYHQFLPNSQISGSG